MTRIIRFRLLVLLSFGFLVAACGSEDDAEPLAEVDVSAAISEQDLDGARANFDAARTLWGSEGSDTYALKIGVQTISLVQYDVVDGVVVGSEVLMSDGDNRFIENLPQTVDALFEQVDSMISELEDDSKKVLPAGECGWHFNVRFDPDLGYPTYYDSLGPCDDGVGIAATVVLAE